MPTLAAETNLFPHRLLEDACVPTAERRWWAVQTKSRQEKSLARDLLNCEIPFYLPLIRKYSLVRGRKTCSYLPLFSGYLFLYADETERVRSLTSNRISQLLPVLQQEPLRHDLWQLNRLMETDSLLTWEPWLQPGRRVRIHSGPLLGVEGTFICRRGESRLLVAIDFLQQGASLEIAEWLLEPIMPAGIAC